MRTQREVAMTAPNTVRSITPRPEFRREVETHCGQLVTTCFQCQKCSTGCPVTFAMDILPHRLIRAVHLGLKDEVLGSRTIWTCASCETCSTRCPNGIDIAHVMDAARQLCQEQGYTPGLAKVPAFHRAFLGSIRRHGRVSEMEMATEFILRTDGVKGVFGFMGYGLALLKHGKVKISLASLKGQAGIRKLFQQSGL
jgi:heterodisulfide reductase subunit C